MRQVMVCTAIGVRIFFGQAASPPTFDAASVKVNQSASGHTSVHSSPGSITMSNVTLRLCLTRAYRTTDPQVFGPAWIDSDRYDIVARQAEGAQES